MKEGINPGVYIEVKPLPYPAETGGATTQGLFVGFAERGKDSEPVLAINNRDLLEKFGTPDKTYYGYQLYNAYQFSRVSGFTWFFRVLPWLEDAPVYRSLDDLKAIKEAGNDPNKEDYVRYAGQLRVKPYMATFANVVFLMLQGKNEEAPYLIAPVNFVPRQWHPENPAAGILYVNRFVQSVYLYEAKNGEIADNFGIGNPITKSYTLQIFYKEEPTPITIAGVFNSKDATLSVNYAQLKNVIANLYNLDKINDDKILTYVEKFLNDFADPSDLQNVPTFDFSPEKLNTTDDQIKLPERFKDKTFYVIVKDTTETATHYKIAIPQQDFTIHNNDDGTVTIDFSGRRFSGAKKLTALIVPTFTGIALAPHGQADIELETYDQVLDDAELQELLYGTKESLIQFLGFTRDGIDELEESFTVQKLSSTKYRVTNVTDEPILVVPFALKADDNYFFKPETYSKVHTLTTFEENVTLKIGVDKAERTTGYNYLVFVNGKPVPYDEDSGEPVCYCVTHDVGHDKITVKLVGNPGDTRLIQVVKIPTILKELTIKTKPVYGILGKGMGGWYNNLAIQLTPQFDVSETGIVPEPNSYSLVTYAYNGQIGNYVAVGTPIDFSIEPNATDAAGNSLNLEQLVNLYSEYLQVLQNDDLIEDLWKKQSLGDRRFKTAFQQLFYIAYKLFGTDKIRLRGGDDGLLRHYKDGTINWITATSLLIKAIQGVYTRQIYNRDEFLVDLVFDAGYPDPVKHALVQYCELREDCVAILDSANVPTVDALIQWYDKLSLNSWYASVWAPWVKVFDIFKSKLDYFPMSYILAYMIPYNDMVNGFWWPIAGLKRGVIKEQIYRYSINVMLDELNSDLARLVVRGINIAGKKQGLNVIWGNYTTYRENSALQSWHASRVLAKIYRELRFAWSKVIWDLALPEVLAQIRDIAIAVLNEYLGTAIEKYEKPEILYNELDRQKRRVRVKLSVTPYLEVRKIVAKITVR